MEGAEEGVHQNLKEEVVEEGVYQNLAWAEVGEEEEVGQILAWVGVEEAQILAWEAAGEVLAQNYSVALEVGLALVVVGVQKFLYKINQFIQSKLRVIFWLKYTLYYNTVGQKIKKVQAKKNL